MSMPLQPVIVSGLSVRYGTRPVLSGIDLTAAPGLRIGLVGENGSGKTTLLRAIAGTLPRHAQVSGDVAGPPDLVLLGQEPPFSDDETVAEVLNRTLAPLRRMVAEVERLSGQMHGEVAASAYADALDLAVAHQAWDAGRRAEESAERLGLGVLDPARRIGTLSGGQRTRLALAGVMTTRPWVLLLDEPTNHLDDDAIGALTTFLSGLPGVVVLASHDRVLLDEVCTDLFDLDPAELGTDGAGGRRFGGGWSAYQQHKAASRRRWEETYLAQQEEIGRLRDATRIGTSAIAHNRGPRDNDKHIYGFKRQNVQRALTRRKKDAQRRLQGAERNQVRKPRAPLRLHAGLTGAGAGGRIVQVRGLRVGCRLAVQRLDVDAGEHLLVTGVNGSGKSTLLGVLAGRIAASHGTVSVNARRVAELPQDVRFADPGLSTRATYEALVGRRRAADTPLRDLGLLPPDRHTVPVALLSVGQRRRLGLAVAIAAGPDLLLLDEPTNHISLALADEIEQAMATTPGTLVVATHDRWLRRRWEGAALSLTGVQG